jgi:hypothetical protein
LLIFIFFTSSNYEISDIHAKPKSVLLDEIHPKIKIVLPIFAEQAAGQNAAKKNP